MCTYSLMLDDQLVAEAETTLKNITLQAWLQQQVESLLKEQVRCSAKDTELHGLSKKVFKARRRSENAPTDSQLEARFAGLEQPELPVDPSWEEIINANSGKTIKPVEKWL